MEGGRRNDEIERTDSNRASGEQTGGLNAGDRREEPRSNRPTTPGTGGGVAETGTPGPGPAARPAGGAKDPAVRHDIPPSARDQ